MSKHKSAPVEWASVFEWTKGLGALGYWVEFGVSAGHDDRSGYVHVKLVTPLEGSTIVVAEDREPFAARSVGSAAGAALRAVVRLHLWQEGKDRVDLARLARWEGKPRTPVRIDPRA